MRLWNTFGSWGAWFGGSLALVYGLALSTAILFPASRLASARDLEGLGGASSPQGKVTQPYDQTICKTGNCINNGIGGGSKQCRGSGYQATIGSGDDYSSIKSVTCSPLWVSSFSDCPQGSMMQGGDCTGLWADYVDP